MIAHLRPPRPGLSLFQLLVLLALLALLFGLFLPAILQVRKAAERIQCTNNLKQIDLATINCADTNNGALPPLAGRYPPAPKETPTSRGSLFFHILPYLEQDNLYKSGKDDGKGFTFSPWNGGVYSKTVVTYVCTTDHSGGVTHQYDGWLGTGSYAGNFLVFGDPNTNAMEGRSRFPASISDGTSNTVFATERYQRCNGTPNGWAYDGQSSWAPAFAYASHGKFQATPTEHQCDPDLAQSPHPGGINAGLGDGSVRFVSNQVSAVTWWYACTPAGGEVLGSDW